MNSAQPDPTTDSAAVPAVPEAHADGQQDEASAKFATLAEFMDWWVTVWEQKISTGRKPVWCPRWFEHPEAVLRLEALWRSFEAARQDPLNGMATRLRDIADHHMGQLTGEASPFRRCKESGHQPPELELSTDPIPAGYLDQRPDQT